MSPSTDTVNPRRVPELLAPAGDWECARAAVENGADAIYFGLSRFNARLRAKNFTEADLPKLMAWLHRRGARGYVTFNTLVFTHELDEADRHLRALIAAGVDAAIVQDVGVCRLIRRISPDFPIHASTQMTVTSAAGVRFARRLGCQLVVLARENSLREIDQIQASLKAARQDLPLEVFVHGALCVAYSGQCLTSEALGGRSANRGECAQACRLPYELIADNQPVDLGDRRYLLSPQDLAGLDLVPELVRAGVASLKIEGRLKSPEYVASITRLYREALDRAAGESPSRAPGSKDPEARYAMEMAFSRGLHTGWLGGIDNQRLVHGRFGKKRGAYLGRVARVDHDRVWIDAEGPCKAGDGVVFDAGRPEEPEEGGRVFDVRSSPRNPNRLGLSFLRGSVNSRRIQTGDRVWKTSDPELNRALRQSFTGDQPRRTRPVRAEVHGRAGAPLTLILSDELGSVVQVHSSMPLVEALRHPLDDARLREHFGRLGGAPFHLGELANHLEGAVILPAGELNRLRREAVQKLEERRAQPRRWEIIATEETSVLPPANPAPPPDTTPQCVALVRALPQLEAALSARPDAICLEFENPRRLRDGVRMAREGGAREVFVAPPRVFKPGEEWILRQTRDAAPDGFLARNYDHLEQFAGARLIGDFSLNVANPITADYFLRECGLERVTASYDLNADQLEDLIRRVPPDRLEITLHQHMPMFHMEHCVFCAFLSSGKDYRDCGRPCDRREVKLRDRVGASHPVKADAGCRNTVFNARAQTGAEHAARLIAAGARRFRIEFLDESPDEVARLLASYQRLLRGEITGESLWREFRLVNQLGVTRGQLARAASADLGVNRWTDAAEYAASW